MNPKPGKCLPSDQVVPRAVRWARWRSRRWTAWWRSRSLPCLLNVSVVVAVVAVNHGAAPGRDCSNITTPEHRKYFNTMGIWNPTIQNPETFENWTFWRSSFKWSKCRYDPDHLKANHKNMDVCIWILCGIQFLTKWSGFVMRSHLKSEPFVNQLVFNYSNPDTWCRSPLHWTF